MNCCGINLINQMMKNGAYFDELPYPISHPQISSESDPIIVGSQLDCSTGAWNPLYEPINFSYKWFRNGVELVGEISPSYTTVADGEYYCEVTAINNLNATTTVQSNTITI